VPVEGLVRRSVHRSRRRLSQDRAPQFAPPVPNLSFGSEVLAAVTSKAHLIHVGSLSGRATRVRIRRVMREGVKVPSSRFPLAFRPTGFRFLDHPSPAGEFSSPCGRPTRLFTWTSMGFPRSAPVRRGWGGHPLYPGTSGVLPPGLSFLRVARCITAPGPVTAVCMPSCGLEIMGRRQGFARVRPSSLPLACNSSMAEASLGLNAQLHTPLLPATHVSVGTGLGHWPEVQPVDTSFTWLSLLTWSDLVSHLIVSE
jgi:hypothetical protein